MRAGLASPGHEDPSAQATVPLAIYVPLAAVNAFTDPPHPDVLQTRVSCLRTYVGVGLYLCTLGLVSFVFFCDPLPGPAAKQDAFSIRASANAGLLLITGLFEYYLVHLHQEWRRRGHFQFYRRQLALVRAPFVLVSSGVAATLLLLLWPDAVGAVKRKEAFRLLAAGEMVLLTGIVLHYCWVVLSYQSRRPPPDVEEGLVSALRDPTVTDHNSAVRGDITEQQAELIQYQEEIVKDLSHEILRLQEELGKLERSDDVGSRSDLEHWLAAKDQELRALTAERDQLVGELRLARSVIGSEESELQALHASNQQYADENARLRAMLDEWSARSAKLELLLEAEKVKHAAVKKKVLQRTVSGQ